MHTQTLVDETLSTLQAQWACQPHYADIVHTGSCHNTLPRIHTNTFGHVNYTASCSMARYVCMQIQCHGQLHGQVCRCRCKCIFLLTHTKTPCNNSLHMALSSTHEDTCAIDLYTNVSTYAASIYTDARRCKVLVSYRNAHRCSIDLYRCLSWAGVDDLASQVWLT